MGKFGRSYRLVIETETPNKFLTIPSQPSDKLLTLDFQVLVSDLSSMGTGSFKIKNLSKISRNLIYKDSFTSPFQRLEFYAGYGGNLSLAFKGVVVDCCSYRAEGAVDVVTQIECNQGAVGMFTGNMSTTLANPQTQAQVINSIINGFNPALPTGYVSPSFNRTYNVRPVTLFGNPWDLLKRETGNQCFVYNGKVYCLPDNEALPGSTYLINSATGLLGSPKRYNRVLMAEMMFEPGIQVGANIDIESSNVGNEFNGIKKVTGIEHSGTISDAVSGELKTKVTVNLVSKLSPGLTEGVLG